MTRSATAADATFEVLRRLELTTIFPNPGSTEVPFLAGLPDEETFVLALHEGSVVADRGPRRADRRLDELLPSLKDRTRPLLLEIAVAQDETFDP